MMTAVKCHHPGISRLRAEELLLTEKKDGSFLIRDSETIAGAYTLCLLYQGRLHQYRILPSDNDMIYIQAEKGVPERKYTDLATLVSEYLNRGTQNGLVYALKHPVEVQETADTDSEDEDDDDCNIKIFQPLAESNETIPRLGTDLPSAGGGDSGSSTLVIKTSLRVPAEDSEEERMPSIDGLLPREMTIPSQKPAPISPKPSINKAVLSQDNQDGIENNPVRRYITERYVELDLTRCDSSFVKKLKGYSEREVYKDSASVSSGSSQLPQLRQLLADEAKELDIHLESFLAKIDVCRELFGPITTVPLVGRVRAQDVSLDLEDLMERLMLCKSAIVKLEKKAIHRLLDLTSDNSSGSVEAIARPPTVPTRRPTRTPVISPASFEVKVLKSGVLGLSHRYMLEVNVNAGKLLMVKRSRDFLDENSVITHDKVMQIIKSTSNNCRLDLQIAGHKSKDTVLFNDVRERESFCQLMQEMKFVHNVHQEVDRLSLYVGTWNMGNEPAPTDIHNWLLCQGCGKSRDKVLTVIPHDMYVIGTQESAMTEKEWIARLQRTLSDCLQTDFVPVTTSVLWDIRLVILVKPEYKNKITHIQQSTVKTGIANALGNKGAAAISFSFNGTSFCFINCHLTSGVEKNHRRNQNVIDIIKGLNLGTKALNVFDITNQFHHVFFLGDLNYRIDGMEPVSVIDKIRQEKYQTLLQYDQLTISRDRNQCFVGFVEEEITFPPTYRIARGSEDKYEWQKFKKTCVKINAPSWCDRVLHKSYPGTYIINTSYGCVNMVMTSDHKPVFSSFDVGIISQFAGTRSVSSLTDKSDVMIIFENVKAEIKTSTKEQFKLEFYSSCLEAPVVSNCNWEFGDHCHSLSRPQWSAPQIPQMCPFVQDRDYLEDQHLLVALKSDDGMESYGECVIPLKSKFSLKAQPFTYNLTHYSQETGLLTGNMYVKSKDNKIKPNRRSFELIYMDTDTLFFQRQLLQAPKLEEKTSSLGESSLLQADQRSPDPKQPNTCESSSLSSLVSSSSSSSSSSSASSSQLKANGKPTLGKQSDQLPAVRKPRMGQSSLCPINVLPVTRSANPVQAPSGGNEYVYTGSHSQSIPDVDGSNGQPAPEKRFEKSSSDHKQNPAYDTLRKPSSIKEWLTDLGFEQYIPHFLENGWDNLSFIQDLTDRHLRDINVRVPEHRSKILKSIAILHGHSSSAV